MQTPVPTSTPDPWAETVIPPGCTTAGSILRINQAEGVTLAEAGEPALGHDWGAWTEADRGYRRICRRCGAEEQRAALHEGPLPRIDFTGSMEGISKSERVMIGLRFSSKDAFFDGYAYASWQGHATLSFPKKNYTIRMYDDGEMTRKHRFQIGRWQLEHKYILKANYRDITQCRNLTAADLWADMAAGRPNLYHRLKATSHYGAVDGFPVEVYLNGAFHGLYTMNLHIDEDLYQMYQTYDAVMISNSSGPEETLFRAPAAFADEKSAWEVEYCGTGEDDQWAKDELNSLIDFVMSSSDEAFRSHLNEKLDVDGAIDYLLFLYAIGLPQNAAKDLVLLKYQDAGVWIPTVYDLEGAFGLDLETLTYLEPGSFLPSCQDGRWDSGTGSLLWDRLLQSFEPEIRARYADLRGTVLSEESLTDRIREKLAAVPDDAVRADLALWPRQLPDEAPAEQMTAYVLKRLPLLDGILR